MWDAIKRRLCILFHFEIAWSINWWDGTEHYYRCMKCRSKHNAKDL